MSGRVVPDIERSRSIGTYRYRFWMPSWSRYIFLLRYTHKKTLDLTQSISRPRPKTLHLSLMKVYYVYILLCADKTYYTGVTSNLNSRLEKHVNGFYRDSYTYKRRPLELVFYAEFTNVDIAIEKEKQIKKWSQAKKKALIEGRYDDLTNLAKKDFGK